MEKRDARWASAPERRAGSAVVTMGRRSDRPLQECEYLALRRVSVHLGFFEDGRAVADDFEPAPGTRNHRELRVRKMRQDIGRQTGGP